MINNFIHEHLLLKCQVLVVFDLIKIVRDCIDNPASVVIGKFQKHVAFLKCQHVIDVDETLCSWTKNMDV